MTRPAPRPLSIAVQGFTATIAPATPLARLQEVWPAAVGEAVAQAARPIAERSGAVTVACESAVWAQELSLMEPTLVTRLNAALGGPLVSELRCRVG
jgi:predicted nucleic acid-binding Zn ribbon protein